MSILCINSEEDRHGLTSLKVVGVYVQSCNARRGLVRFTAKQMLLSRVVSVDFNDNLRQTIKQMLSA
jgi:hypothetical protein